MLTQKSNRSYNEWAEKLKVDTEEYPFVITQMAKQTKYLLSVDLETLENDSFFKFLGSWSKGIAKGYKIDEEVGTSAQKKQNTDL